MIKAILKGNPNGLTKTELVHELVDTHSFGKTAAYDRIKEYADCLMQKNGRFYAQDPLSFRKTRKRKGRK